MKRILVADDEPSIRQTLQIMLERAEYKVDTAENVPEAMKLLEKQQYDAVLTDIIMPRLSGVELLAHIRKNNPDLPVIMMTGEPSLETATQAVQQSAFDYISKPVSKQILLRVVSQAVQYHDLILQKQAAEEKNQQYQQNLENMVRQRTSELEKAMQSTIKVLVSLIDAQDPYTAGHQQRVGNLAAALAEEMGLPDKTAAGLRITGYLHDIGKMSIPAEILVKPSRLNYYEFAIVKMHSQTGYEILKLMDLPWPVADIVCQHHERLDGSGYPQGLKGNAICLEAQIIAVADVVEAMASHRPYRPGLGLDAALQEIEDYRGIRFNHDVVGACRRLFREKHYQIDSSFIDQSITFR